ncbi:response regulator transcription factor [Cohnella zeiphila]|uniref:Response regulator n=1 Tax=Cohnella zeiphila TaxID=2761120 RepID=A0A7X0SSN2_9BACL|nr:response regulator [Cohnella zeiphila]MBB6734384.1 response regulator [Cohnella zeiphila]
MNRLLIVDNEDYVVEGLVDVMRRLSYLDLEVIGAYSAKEALEWLKRTKIDIVISDIRMPGMDGLTLQREIVRYWPRCKVIFLSGFNEFDYAQTAIRGGAVDYVLKTDGDERLVAAVEKAIERLRDEIEFDQLIVKSKNQMRLASEALQQDFVRQMLHGERIERDELERQFANLGIPLRPWAPVLAVVGRVDDGMDHLSYYERYLLLYSIRNIAGEYLDTAVSQMSVPTDRFHIVWVAQPKGLHPDSSPRMRDDMWRIAASFVQGAFELIQSACKDLIKLELSVLIADSPVDWDGLSRKFVSLKANMLRGLGSGRGLLMVDQTMSGDGIAGLFRDSAAWIGSLASMLENSRREPFLVLLNEMLEQGDAESQEKHYFMAASVLLSFHTKEMRLDGTGERWDVARLIHPDPAHSPEEAITYLRRCGESVFDFRERSRGESENELMTKVKKYIADHLSDELSLTGIAEDVGHNSSYLSRLFKQKNGIGVAEYITECRIRLAKELLADSDRRIQEIASLTGFASVQYFYRVFKKATGMTPHEWRERSCSR